MAEVLGRARLLIIHATGSEVTVEALQTSTRQTATLYLEKWPGMHGRP